MANQCGRTHGCSFMNGKPTPEYKSWQSAKDRCFNPGATKYPRYGAIGITMCQRWADSFEAFLEDMGPRPAGTTLERENNKGNYEPGNCRWATARDQAINRCSTRMLTINGKTQCVADWAREVHLRPARILARLYAGWTPEKAVLTPGRKLYACA